MTRRRKRRKRSKRMSTTKTHSWRASELSQPGKQWSNARRPGQAHRKPSFDQLNFYSLLVVSSFASAGASVRSTSNTYTVHAACAVTDAGPGEATHQPMVEICAIEDVGVVGTDAGISVT